MVGAATAATARRHGRPPAAPLRLLPRLAGPPSRPVGRTAREVLLHAPTRLHYPDPPASQVRGALAACGQFATQAPRHLVITTSRALVLLARAWAARAPAPVRITVEGRHCPARHRAAPRHHGGRRAVDAEAGRARLDRTGAGAVMVTPAHQFRSAWRCRAPRGPVALGGRRPAAPAPCGGRLRRRVQYDRSRSGAQGQGPRYGYVGSASKALAPTAAGVDRGARHLR